MLYRRNVRKGAIHLTKNSGNSGTKSNGTERFWKFVSKIVDNLRRLSFFLEIWKFRKFPVPFGISTRFESTPVPLVVKNYKMAASKSVESTLHWMQNDLPRLEPVLDRKTKTLGSDCLENYGLVVPPEFPVGQFARFAYSFARKVRKFLS